MYSRCDASGALLQLISQGRREFRAGWEGGGGAGGGVTDFEEEPMGGGRLLQQTVARKHLWLLFALDKKMPKLTDGEAVVKCHCCPPGSWKNAACVSISDAVFILERGCVAVG